MIYHGTSTSTVSFAGPPQNLPKTLTLQALVDAMDKIGPEPIGEWMREKGFPPETSLLFLPPTTRDQSPFWPKYVRFTTYVVAPTMVRDMLSHTGSMGVWDGERYRK